MKKIYTIQLENTLAKLDTNEWWCRFRIIGIQDKKEDAEEMAKQWRKTHDGKNGMVVEIMEEFLMDQPIELPF